MDPSNDCFRVPLTSPLPDAFPLDCFLLFGFSRFGRLSRPLAVDSPDDVLNEERPLLPLVLGEACDSVESTFTILSLLVNCFR